MDRHRPLWDFTLVHGLKGNRTGAVIRMHHCLADGIAGVGLLTALLDPSPTPPPKPKEKEPLHAPPRPLGEKSLLNDLISSSMSAVKRFLAAESELLALTKQVIAGVEEQPEAAEARAESATNPEARTPLLDELQRVLPDVAATPNRLPFNVVCRGPQKFNWARNSAGRYKGHKAGLRRYG